MKSVLAVIVLGLIAAGCMAGIVGFLPAYLRGPSMATTQPAAEIEILVAAKDLPAMAIVNGDCLETRKLPAGTAPQDRLSDPVQAVGRVLILPMVKGQAFNKTCFVSDGSGAQLASALPNGMRAVSVLLENDASLRTLLYPGCVVDVLASVCRPADQGQPRARTLLQGVQVLAVEDRTIVSGESEKAESVAIRHEIGRKCLVTLMVDADQAKLLQAAQREGTVSLALRNPLDKTNSVAATDDEVEHVAPPPARNMDVIIMRDGKSEVRSFTLNH